MVHKNALEIALSHGIIPVVSFSEKKYAKPLATALIAGGLPVAEVSFSTPDAHKALRSIAGRDDFIVGAGTVITLKQARLAKDSGAAFIVSPGYDEHVVRFCIDAGIPVMPGVCTPTEIQAAMAQDLNLFKFFPAGAFGGPRVIKSMTRPYPSIRLVPQGGIHPGNFCDYLTHPQVVAVGVSWMVKADLMEAGHWNEITRLSRMSVDAAATVLADKRHG